MKHLLAATAAAALATAAPAAAAPITFNFTGAIVTWTATETGTYEIVAIGAQGGAATFRQSFSGGKGALIGGYFDLIAGTTLQLAVGGMGASNLYFGGGGGGSFVVGPGITPLVIAGGGGGISSRAAQNGWDANTGEAGLTGSANLTSGGGVEIPFLIGLGGPASGSYGAAGGGFYGAGANDSNSLLILGSGGASWAGGLAGGITPGTCGGAGTGGNGGFGGGGSGSGCGTGGGGGGGYSGGRGGTVAGGGGSYNADVLTGWSQAGAGTGNGSITINLMQQVTTPEPASAALAVLGLFALAAVRRRK